MKQKNAVRNKSGGIFCFMWNIFIEKRSTGAKNAENVSCETLILFFAS